MLLYLSEINIHIKKHSRFLLLLSGALILNMVIALVPQMATYTVARFLEIYIVYIICATERKKNLPLMISALVAGACLQALLTTLQFVNKSSIQTIFYFFGERFFTLSSPGIATTSLDGNEFLRPYGTFSHPNSLGGFYVAVYALSIGLLSQTKKILSPLRIPLIVLAALSSFLVFFSFSKAAIGTFLLITVVHALLQFANRPKHDKKSCIPCAISRIFIPLVLGILFFQAKGDVYSIDKRLNLIEQAMVLFQQHPVLGVGFGNHLYAQAQFPSKYAEFFLQPVHNIFLLLLVQGGILITSIAGWVAIQSSSRNRLYIVLAIIMTGLVDHYWVTLIQNMLLLGVVFGVQEK